MEIQPSCKAATTSWWTILVFRAPMKESLLTPIKWWNKHTLRHWFCSLLHATQWSWVSNRIKVETGSNTIFHCCELSNLFWDLFQMLTKPFKNSLGHTWLVPLLPWWWPWICVFSCLALVTHFMYSFFSLKVPFWELSATSVHHFCSWRDQ